MSFNYMMAVVSTPFAVSIRNLAAFLANVEKFNGRTNQVRKAINYCLTLFVTHQDLIRNFDDGKWGRHVSQRLSSFRYA